MNAKTLQKIIVTSMLFVRILLENTNVNAKMDTMVTAGSVQVSFEKTFMIV